MQVFISLPIARIKGERFVQVDSSPQEQDSNKLETKDSEKIEDSIIETPNINNNNTITTGETNTTPTSLPTKNEEAKETGSSLPPPSVQSPNVPKVCVLFSWMYNLNDFSRHWNANDHVLLILQKFKQQNCVLLVRCLP